MQSVVARTVKMPRAIAELRPGFAVGRPSGIRCCRGMKSVGPK